MDGTNMVGSYGRLAHHNLAHRAARIVVLGGLTLAASLGCIADMAFESSASGLEVPFRTVEVATTNLDLQGEFPMDAPFDLSWADYLPRLPFMPTAQQSLDAMMERLERLVPLTLHLGANDLRFQTQAFVTGGGQSTLVDARHPITFRFGGALFDDGYLQYDELVRNGGENTYSAVAELNPRASFFNTSRVTAVVPGVGAHDLPLCGDPDGAQTAHIEATVSFFQGAASAPTPNVAVADRVKVEFDRFELGQTRWMVPFSLIADLLKKIGVNDILGFPLDDVVNLLSQSGRTGICTELQVPLAFTGTLEGPLNGPLVQGGGDTTRGEESDDREESDDGEEPDEDDSTTPPIASTPSVTPVTLDASGHAALQGNINPAGDSDWYKITVPAGRELTVSLSSCSSGLDTVAQLFEGEALPNPLPTGFGGSSSCGATPAVACEDSGQCNEVLEHANTTAVPRTFHVRIYDYGSGGAADTGTGTYSVQFAAAAPLTCTGANQRPNSLGTVCECTNGGTMPACTADAPVTCLAGQHLNPARNGCVCDNGGDMPACTALPRGAGGACVEYDTNTTSLQNGAALLAQHPEGLGNQMDACAASCSGHWRSVFSPDWGRMASQVCRVDARTGSTRWLTFHIDPSGGDRADGARFSKAACNPSRLQLNSGNPFCSDPNTPAAP